MSLPARFPEISFTAEERNFLFAISEKLTGNLSNQNSVILTNLKHRMLKTGFRSLLKYLAYIGDNPEEFNHFISCLLINTTEWFRELPHFHQFEAFVTKVLQKNPEKKFHVLSSACSTGEELYSFGLILEHLRAQFPKLEYRLEGHDIDKICLSQARQGYFLARDSQKIPPRFRDLLIHEEDQKGQQYIRMPPEIMRRTYFRFANIKSHIPPSGHQYDIICCRNVLIYFRKHVVTKVINELTGLLAKTGILILGHSEAVRAEEFGLIALGNSVYKRDTSKKTLAPGTMRRKVLVIEDSTTMRTLLEDWFRARNYLVSGATQAQEATELLNRIEFDLITLDLNLPDMNGQAWLKRQRKKGLKTPVVVISDANPREADNILGALENGAQDFIEKKHLNNGDRSLERRIEAILESARRRARIEQQGCKHLPNRSSRRNQSILIVEPAEKRRFWLAEILENRGHRCVVAATGREALGILKANPIAIIVTVQKLSDTDAIELCKQVRHIASTVPFVVCTRSEERNRIAFSMKVGITDLIDVSASENSYIELIESYIEVERPKKKILRDFRSPVQLILIGASTGGPDALSNLLRSMPSSSPPIVIVQHIAESFARPLAERLADTSHLTLGSPRKGTNLERGHLYMAHGDYHIGVIQNENRLILTNSSTGHINKHRPSIDFLFRSAVGLKNTAMAAILLTGMGKDGASGLNDLHKQGAFTLVQDVKSSVVFGMPREAIRLGAADFIGNPEEIRQELDRLMLIRASHAAS